MSDKKRYQTLENRVSQLEGQLNQAWETIENHQAAMYGYKTFIETFLEGLSDDERKLFEARASEKTKTQLEFLREEAAKDTDIN